MKKIHKLAIIRDNEEARCPFGLPITQSCLMVGDAVDDMKVIIDEDDFDAISKENLKALGSNPEPKRCKYAAHVFKNKKHVVDCDFGDTAAGLSQQVSFVGSPYYTEIDKGLGIGGLLNYPVTYQTDGSEYRNLYYGINNWASDRSIRSILRQSLLESLKYSKS